MQPAYTTTPYTIHYRGSLIKFNIRTRTSYHTTILCTAAVYPVPSSGCCVYSYAPYNVDDNTGTIPIPIPSYTVIRCCGTPRNTETKYRYSTSRNTGKYRKNTITRFERTIFYKYWPSWLRRRYPSLGICQKYFRQKKVQYPHVVKLVTIRVPYIDQKYFREKIELVTIGVPYIAPKHFEAPQLSLKLNLCTSPQVWLLRKNKNV